MTIPLSRIRSSRLYAHQTFSVFRCPFVRFSCQSFLALHWRKLSTAETKNSVFQCRCFRDATAGRQNTRSDLGSVNATSLCTQDLRVRLSYISSGFPAFPPCSCPLWVSPPGRVTALEGIRFQPPAPLEPSDVRRSGAPFPSSVHSQALTAESVHSSYYDLNLLRQQNISVLPQLGWTQIP